MISEGPFNAQSMWDLGLWSPKDDVFLKLSVYSIEYIEGTTSTYSPYTK